MYIEKVSCLDLLLTFLSLGVVVLATLGVVFTVAAFFTILIETDKNQLQTFVQDVLNPKSVHPNLSLESIEELPNKTGIYKLYNEFNQLIYVGKSIHIKKRIEQHLRNHKTAKGLKMIQDICRVEYELTGSELIAMLLESNLIKEHKPLYNRKLRKSLLTKTKCLWWQVQLVRWSTTLPCPFSLKKM